VGSIHLTSGFGFVRCSYGAVEHDRKYPVYFFVRYCNSRLSGHQQQALYRQDPLANRTDLTQLLFHTRRSSDSAQEIGVFEKAFTDLAAENSELKQGNMGLYSPVLAYVLGRVDIKRHRQ